MMNKSLQYKFSKACFPYDCLNHPHRPSCLKKVSDNQDDHKEKHYTVDRKQPRLLQNLHDCPDRPDRTQFFPSGGGRLSHPGRL